MELLLLSGFAYPLLAKMDHSNLHEELEAKGIHIAKAYTEKKLQNMQYAAWRMRDSSTVYDCIKEALFPGNHKIEQASQELNFFDFPDPVMKLKNVTFDGIYPIGTWDTNK